MMPYYNLLVVHENRMLATVAGSREEALIIFGKELNLRLSLTPNDQPAPVSCMLDEWQEGPHWVNPHIPVFEISN